MKKRIFLIACAVLAIAFVQLAFAKPFWIDLDYNADGVYDCQYQVAEHYITVGQTEQARHFIRVIYRDYACTYLGEEVWVEGLGILKDSFLPWTYPFPQ